VIGRVCACLRERPNNIYFCIVFLGLDNTDPELLPADHLLLFLLLGNSLIMEMENSPFLIASFASPKP